MKKLTKLFAIVLLSLGLTTILRAQQGFSANAPDQSAIVDMTANNKGALLPRVALPGTADVTSIASPTDSLAVLNTATAGTIPNAVIPSYYYGTQTSKWIGLVASDDPSALWDITGNAGTNPSTNFLGTTDAQPLLCRVNNNRSGFLSNADLAFGTNVFISKNTLDGTCNTAFGSNALAATTIASYKKAFGAEALTYNITGDRNIGSGPIAIFGDETGSFNISFGYGSLGAHISNNSDIGVGNQAGSTVETGNDNVSVPDAIVSRAARAINLILPYPATCTGRVHYIINNGGDNITTSLAFGVSTVQTQNSLPKAANGVGTIFPNSGNKYRIQSDGTVWVLMQLG